MIIRGHNHFICYFFDHVCFHFPFTMVLSKCKGSRQKQITTKSSLHFEEISILLSCPSTDSKIVCAAPNLLCHTKIYLDIVLVPNFLCQTKRWFAFKGGFMSEDTGWFLHCQNKYSKSLSWAENLNFPPKSVNNLFKFSSQDLIWNICSGNVKILQYLLI